MTRYDTLYVVDALIQSVSLIILTWKGQQMHERGLALKKKGEPAAQEEAQVHARDIDQSGEAILR